MTTANDMSKIKFEIHLFREGLEKISSEKYLQKVFNTYAEQFNESENKISSFADFQTVLYTLRDRIKKSKQDMESDYGYPPEHLAYMARNIEDNETNESLAELFDTEPTFEGYTPDSYREMLQSVFRESKKYFKYKKHISMLDFITDQIISSDYDKIYLWEELSEGKKEQFHPEPNQFRLDREEEKKNNEPRRQRVYKEARKVIGEHSVSDFFTKKGWPISDLWSPIVRRTNEAESTVKDWLKKAYESKNTALFKKSS